MLIHNAHAGRTSYPAELEEILCAASVAEARSWLSHWSLLHPGLTPLWQLPGLAGRLGVARVAVKDESLRSELGSFKALGAPLALVRLIKRLRPELSPRGLLRGDYQRQVRDLTVISASAGNHGRALAAAAHSIGCACVIVLHAKVNEERAAAIEKYGARLVRVAGNYDDSVIEAARVAAEKGWHIVSDTSLGGHEIVAGDVMQGYACIAAEVVEQSGEAFTHVLVQSGVGGLAAALVSFFWEYCGAARPRFIVVEPGEADCLYQSALRGLAGGASGSVDSLMAGLACGETSPLAWKIIAAAVDDFLTIGDDEAVSAMRLLAAGSARDIPIIAGESGAAGLAGLLAIAADKSRAAAIGLGRHSRVLLINTEGASAPGTYESLVGENAASVAGRQACWLAGAASDQTLSPRAAR